MEFADLVEQRANQRSTKTPPPPPSPMQFDTQSPQQVNQQPDSDPDFSALIEQRATQRKLKGIDVSNDGAPASTRLAVGSAVTPEDRLATVRKTYSDAVVDPNDESNFLYTNPDSGRITRFNPKGFDLGDIAGVAPEIGEFAGSLLGGAAGAAVGNIPGGIVGAGVGGAAGRGLVQEGAEWLLGTEDTRSTGEQVGDLAVTGGLNALGQGVAPLIAKGAKALVKPVISPFVNRGTTELGEDYAKLGVAPSAGAISQNKALQTTESVLGNTPGGAPVMQKAVETQQGQLQDAIGGIISKVGGEAMTDEGLGIVAQKGIKQGAVRAKDTSSQLYDKAYNAVGRDTPMNLSNVAALRTELTQQVADAPESTPSYVKSMLNQMDNIMMDAQGQNGYKFTAGRRMQAEINNQSKTASTMGNPAQGLQKRLAAAMKADMEDTVSGVGGNAKKLYDQAQRYNAKRVQVDKDFVNSFVDKRTAEQVGRELLKPTPNAKTLRQARGKMSGDEWNNVAATAINRLGLAKAGQQGADGDIFSANTFLTNWNRMSTEAKKTLFGGSKYKEIRSDLDRLSRVTASIKEGNKTANPSGTARHMAYMTLLGAVAGGGAASGDHTSAGAGIAGLVIAPKMAAKLMTSPRFVKWLTKTADQKNPRDFAKHMAQLYAIGDINPDVREEVQEFIRAAGNLTPR